MMKKTSLAGDRAEDRLVSKTDRRIRFRGLIDSLEAETIEAQVLASGLGEPYYCGCLGELLAALRGILAAEVKETSFTLPDLFGFSPEELHRQTHNPAASFGLAGHPLPDYRQGSLAARLNTLRAHVREAELYAVRAFCPEAAAGPAEVAARREDLAQALNRLSSALYWLYCRLLSS
ncbi:MAG: hypothetical protein LBQ46_07960 [Treponema sp.]|jgi:ethanolamine utilization cobalamin adenosyltransferase|nr:hypothetical protein [Treponema sp.]